MHSQWCNNMSVEKIIIEVTMLHVYTLYMYVYMYTVDRVALTLDFEGKGICAQV